MTTLPGSLPELRFGSEYRVRARAVDLAGNSIPLNSTTPNIFAAPAGGVLIQYLRFEPVVAPLVVQQSIITGGGSLEHLVIRSRNTDPSLDIIPTRDFDARHIAPPRTFARLAEQHGMFDGPDGHLKGDAATYSIMSTRDKFDLPQQDGTPVQPGPKLKVGYLPDPLARGAAFRDLPNTPDNTNGRISGTALSYTELPDVQQRAGSVTYIDFGSGTWPERESFRLLLVDGNSKPQWDSTNRVLTVSLPKSGEFDFPLTCFLNPSDLPIMGVWQWLQEFFDAAELQVIQGGDAKLTLTGTTDTIALLTRLVLEGGHEMLTPARTLKLIHAVQQPLGRPAFVQLAVVHQPAAPVFASALRNSFTPITAWRAHGSHAATLLGGLGIHAQSSARIDLEARWSEIADDPSQPAPTRAPHTDHVDTVPLNTGVNGMIATDGSFSRYVASYIPPLDLLWFAAPFDHLEGVDSPFQLAAPVHSFDDTKHRWVTYNAVATSRFQEFFQEPGPDFTRTGDGLRVDIPSSARPATPDIAYVVPAFGWENQETTNVKSTVRFGNALRVYLNRPWYSSGDDELLGIVLWPSDVVKPDYPTSEQFKPYFTQWGNDPIWATGNIPDVPLSFYFNNAVSSRAHITLEETSHPFDVVGFKPQFDPKRSLWYCDIEFDLTSYMPFVRLALARYQPHSITGVEVSRVVLADFAQLSPDRSAVLSIEPGNPKSARLFIGGVSPIAPNPNIITVTVEQRDPKVLTDLGWHEAESSSITISADTPAPAEGRRRVVGWFPSVHAYTA